MDPRPKSRQIIGWLGIAILVVGLLSVLIIFSRQSSQVEIIPASQIESEEPKEFVVDVAGAVQNPGVYKLKSNLRFNDALVAAGGLSAQADRDWVAKNVNLAAPLKDSIKIYIKSTNEIKGTVSSEAKININTAELAILDQLPGVGPVTAQKIIDWRNQNGSFSSVEDLLKVPGVGQKLFDKIKDRLAVW